MTTRTLLATTVALLLAACGGAAPTPGGKISIQADLSAMAATRAVLVTVDAQPAKVTAELALDAETGHFVGSIDLPAGPQALTVQAWLDNDGDGTLEVVAAGSAEAVVTMDQVASVLVVLLDMSPPPPVPDHAPILTSAGLSNRRPLVNEAVSLWVSAVDVDEDPIAYLWEASCNAGTATFGDPTAAATTVSVDEAATCTISVSVSANGKQVGAQLSLLVGGSGAATLDIEFYTVPVVTRVAITEVATSYDCTIDRYGSEATCPVALGIGAVAEVFLTLDDQSDGMTTTLDACGTPITLVDSGPGMARFVWTVQEPAGVCVVTASVSRNGRTDSLPVAVLLM
jgi:acylphosphatase